MAEVVSMVRAQPGLGPVAFFEKKVLPKLDVDDVYGDAVTFEQRTGRYWRGTCPLHGGANPTSFSVDVITLRYTCFSTCGSGSALAFLNDGKHPSGNRYVELVQQLAAKKGIELPSFKSANEPDLESKEERRRGLLETYVHQAHGALLADTPEAGAAREYLTQRRGLSQAFIEAVPFGLAQGRKQIILDLVSTGYSKEEVSASGLLNPFWEGRITYPWMGIRRADGIGTIWGRSLDPDDQKKYLRLGGGEKGWALPSDRLLLFGLDEALRGLRAGQHRDLVIVEGFFDVLLCQSLGIKNVVGIGTSGRGLTEEVWARLERMPFQGVTVALDNDSTGEDTLKGAIDRGLSSAVGDRLYVVPGAALGRHKDIDALIRGESVEAFEALLKTRIHALRFKARTIATPAGEGWTDFEENAAIDAAVRFAEANSTRRDLLGRYFWPEVEARIPGFEVAGIEERKIKTREAEERRKADARIQAFFEDGVEASKMGDVFQVRRLLREEAPRLMAEAVGGKIEVRRPVSDELPDLDTYLAKLRETEFLGIPQRHLASLDERLSGLRGVMLLASAPNLGKTALAGQVFFDAVRENQDTVGVFVSLEMDRKTLYLRMLARLAKLDYRTLVYGSKPGRGPGEAIKFSTKESGSIERARDELADVGKRIIFLDRANTTQVTPIMIAQQVERLKDQAGAKRAVVVIDYLNVWPVSAADSGPRSELESDKAQMEQCRQLYDLLGGEPLLAIAEARKPAGGGARQPWVASIADLMGSARFGYAADVVMTIQPFSSEEIAKHLGIPIQRGKSVDDHPELAQFVERLSQEGKALSHLTILKGRDGVERGTIDLTFRYRRSDFREGAIAETRRRAA